MIKVIKHGEKHEQQIECSMCGCVFIFGLEDRTYDNLGFPYVRCPDCGKLLLASSRKMETAK